MPVRGACFAFWQPKCSDATSAGVLAGARSETARRCGTPLGRVWHKLLPSQGTDAGRAP